MSYSADFAGTKIGQMYWNSTLGTARFSNQSKRDKQSYAAHGCQCSENNVAFALQLAESRSGCHHSISARFTPSSK
jgi:uncharacterized protein YqkB